MTSGKDDEEFFRQRGFGVKIGFGERPALIVIDMIKGFTDASMPLGAPLEKQIAAQKPLLDVAHERGIPVIFSTVIYNEDDLKDAGLWAIKMKGTLTLKAGTEAVEVDPRLDMRPTDSLLVKKYASCFFGTDLVPRLMNQRVDTLIITGCTTRAACALPRSTQCRTDFARWWCARRSATARRRRTSRACSISMPSMPTWSGSTRRCNT